MTLPLAPHTVVGNRYELTDRIAVGGMGEVWRAHDRVLSRDVAVKVLKAEYAADPAFLARFRNEARHTAALSHPGIANVFDYGEIGDTAYLVMELVQGEPLSQLLAREHRLSPDRTLDLVGQAALALQAAHDLGVVHRDVKPGNVLIRPDGVVKVTDFGIARAIDSAPVTQTGMLVGTAAYVSPEQAAGKPATAASDIYSLGLVAYECLAGRRAFDADGPVAIAMAHLRDTPPPLPKDVPPLVVDFVTQALDKDPSRRQPSAGDFGRTALALAATLRDAPGGTTSTTSAAPPQTKVMPATAAPPVDDAHRRRVRNIFVAVGAAVVLLGFLLLRSCDPNSTKAHPGAAEPSPTASTTPAVVTVDAAAYVGKSVASARSALTALGMRVVTSSVVAGAPAGTVVGVTPTGTRPRGSTVTLTVAAAPAPAPVPRHGKHHGGKGDH
jgi:hypothetical protein